MNKAKKAASEKASSLVATGGVSDGQTQLPDTLPDLSEFSGAGQVNDVKFLAIPFLSLIGIQSSYTLEGTDKYIDGARPGMFVESLNRFLWDAKPGVTVVPVLCKVVVSKIDGSKPKSRSRIGKYGQVEGEAIKAECRQDGFKFYNEDGDYYEDELEYYVLILDGKDIYQACVSMHGTRIKKAKNWNSLIAQKKIDGGRPAPIFAAKYQLTSVLEQKDDVKWYNYDIADAGLITDPVLLRTAIAFHKVVAAGDYENLEDEEGDSAAGKDI